MKIDMENLLDSIMDSLSEMDYIRPEELPNIDLYMDQVTTFMDRQLASSKRYEDDKILTKTMINNYAKNRLLPAPDKKKYSRDHMLTLIFIYYLKNILSINDIKALLDPITDNYFGKSGGLTLKDIYREVFRLGEGELDKLKKDVLGKYDLSRATFRDAAADEEERQFLEVFAFVCMLSFDVYVKKQIIEKIIDALPDREEKKEKKRGETK